MKLTVFIPTLNEELDLGRTLNSLQFADQVIVVDSGSTDKTIEIAKKFGAKVVTHPFTSYSDQRNFCDSLVTDGWILSLEADVVVSVSLAKEIKEAIDSTEVEAFFIGRVNIIWGKEILHTDWGPSDDCHIWLYKKGAGKWVSDVHEHFETSRPTGKLINTLTHYNYRTISEFIDKTNSYSEMAKKSVASSLWLAPFRDFAKRYLYKAGFRDGYHGLFLSYLQSIYHWNVLVKGQVQ